jgi:RNA polymerase primary sigma factor
MKEITTDRTILTENDELLAKYFKSISKYPVYNSEEQIELAKKIKNGDKEAREKLITSNLRFLFFLLILSVLHYYI